MPRPASNLIVAGLAAAFLAAGWPVTATLASAARPLAPPGEVLAFAATGLAVGLTVLAGGWLSCRDMPEPVAAPTSCPRQPYAPHGHTRPVRARRASLAGYVARYRHEMNGRFDNLDRYLATLAALR